MISVLAQERLLGAALGCAFIGAVVFEQRRGIYRSISDAHPIDKALYEVGIFFAYCICIHVGNMI